MLVPVSPLRNLLLAAAIFTLATAAAARPGGPWTSIGPYGGFVRALGASPSSPSIYLVSDDGSTFHSTDGTAWTPGGFGSGILQIAVDAADPHTALAAAWYDGVLRTRDGGRSWTKAFPSLDVGAAAIAADPVKTGVFYVATTAGVYRTIDAGEHWLAPSQFAFDCTAVLVDSQNPLRVYALSVFGLLQSGDRGATWSRGAPQYFGLPAVIASDSASSTVFSATSNAVTAQVIRSRDAGAHWEPAGAPFVGAVTALIAPGAPGVVLAGTTGGLFRSEDLGDHWSPTSISGTGVWNLVSDSARDILAGTASGVISSADQGIRWETRNTGFNRRGVSSIAPSFAAPGDLFAVVSFGFPFRWKGATRQWDPVGAGTDPPVGIGVIATTASDPSLVFAASSINCQFFDAFRPEDSTPFPPPLYVSRDGGATWEPTAGTGNDCGPLFVSVDPLNTSSLFLGQIPFGGGLQRTADQGATWVACDQYFDSLAFDPASSPETIVASAGFVGSKVGRSVDGGQTWNLADVGVSIDHLATASQGGTIYGSSVESDSSGILETVYRSADHGQTWQPTSFSSLAVTALAVDPGNASRVFAASDRGIFQSFDHGDSWNPLPGFSNEPPAMLAISPDARQIFAGTYCCGVWELELPLNVDPIAPPVFPPIGGRAGLATANSARVCVR